MTYDLYSNQCGARLLSGSLAPASYEIFLQDIHSTLDVFLVITVNNTLLSFYTDIIIFSNIIYMLARGQTSTKL